MLLRQTDKCQLKQLILGVVDEMSEGERIAVYQDGCEHFNYLDDMVFPMMDFDELEGGHRPFSEVYRDIDTDNFSFNDNYYYLDGYAYYHSFSRIKDCQLADLLDDFIDSAIDEEYDFSDPKIAEVFEVFEEVEDE